MKRVHLNVSRFPRVAISTKCGRVRVEISGQASPVIIETSPFNLFDTVGQYLDGFFIGEDGFLHRTESKL